MISEKSLLEMANGGFLERVSFEMPKILDNIMDPNTKATATRKIIITMELIPDESRCGVIVRFKSECKMVPTNPIQTSLYITSDPSTGELCVMELAPQIPGQFSFDGGEQSTLVKMRMIKNA